MGSVYFDALKAIIVYASNRGNEHVDKLTNRAIDALQARRDAFYENRLTWTF